MRGSLVLLAVLTACSDASAPHHGLVLTTELPLASVPTGQAITVTLNASNPTDTLARLSFSLPAVFTEVEQNARWVGGPDSATGTDTLDLTPGASAPLGTVSVIFYAPPGPINVLVPIGADGNGQYFTLSPGSYAMRACYYPFWISTPLDYVPQPICGNRVAFTLTQ